MLVAGCGDVGSEYRTEERPVPQSDRTIFWIHKSRVQKGSTWRDPESVDAETRDFLQDEEGFYGY